MKNVLDLLYKNKTDEERPKICVIKTQSTITPEEQLSLNEWKAEYKVGMHIEHKEGIYNAHSMMSLWDDEKYMKYLKDTKLH